MISTFPAIFFSAGVPLAVCFYRKDSSLFESQPIVVVTGSWLTVKEQMAAVYAKALAERGFTAFIFDFTGFGESEGSLRQAEIPSRKIVDLRAAVEFVKTMGFVDPSRVGVLAICASAQYALTAIAGGLDVASFVSVAGWYHDPESIAAVVGGPTQVAAKLALAKAAGEAFYGKREVLCAPAYEPGNSEAGMSMKLDYYADRKRGALPAWKSEMAVITWLYWLNFDGLRAASLVKVPSLLVHSDQCMLPDNARKIHAALLGKKQLFWTDGTQIDFYDQPPFVEKAIDAAEKHLNQSFTPDSL